MKKLNRAWCCLLFCSALLISGYSPAKGQNGLWGYIASYPAQAPAGYVEGYGFYSAIWPLIDTPISNFQIGLPSTWITPDNTDNKTTPLCPVGTIARDNWPERGPTYSSVFQTVEGGPGYWAGNKFHYNSPKFKLNSTPNCYSKEISNPGWPFFWSDEPLADSVLGVAQISNRILVPPDGMTFQGDPNGLLLGITYMALPLTSPYNNGYPVGEKSWTCFLNASNFKGPLAYFLPETWAKISKNYPFDNNRGLDSRSAEKNLAGGTMEINTVPIMSAVDAAQNRYYKIPRLQFPVDSLNRTILARDVTFYSKKAIYNDLLEWKKGGPAPSGAFQTTGSYKPVVRTNSVEYKQQGKTVMGINNLATPVVIQSNEFGLQWKGNVANGMGYLPQYFRDSANFRVAVSEADLPASTGLREKQFDAPSDTPSPYNAELKGAWRYPGPVAGPFYAYLADHSMVVYFWYRFIDQPVFQQYNWSQAKKDSLQSLVEKIHRNWTPDKEYMKAPTGGKLVEFDNALFVTPPDEYAIGYVPVIVHQEYSTAGSAKSDPVPTLPAFRTYPSPASDLLYVNLQTVPGRQSVFRIMDLTGNVIRTIRPDQMAMSLDISNLSKGVYLVSYSDGIHNQCSKFVKSE